jgi:hypothetical protein
MMFGTLKTLARQNVETRNQQLRKDVFAFQDSGGQFMVSVPGRGRPLDDCVYFELRGDDATVIAVFEGRKTTAVAEYRVGLDEDGNCRLQRDGAFVDPWQVLKAALESFLFR